MFNFARRGDGVIVLGRRSGGKTRSKENDGVLPGENGNRVGWKGLKGKRARAPKTMARSRGTGELESSEVER